MAVEVTRGRASGKGRSVPATTHGAAILYFTLGPSLHRFGVAHEERRHDGEQSIGADAQRERATGGPEREPASVA